MRRVVFKITITILSLFLFFEFGYAQAPNGVFLTEIYYDHPSTDSGYEWVELYNTSLASIDLSSYCLGNGGTNYTYSLVQLTGTIAADQVFVVGGPLSVAENGNPTFDLPIDFNPDFQNGGDESDGVALFNVPCSSVTPSTVPIDAVIYDSPNTNNLLDETGTSGQPDVGDAPAGSSITRNSRNSGSAWTITANPSPNIANNPTAVSLQTFGVTNPPNATTALIAAFATLALTSIFLWSKNKGGLRHKRN